MENEQLLVNEGKKEIIESEFGNYYCYAIKTKVVTKADSLAEVVKTYAAPLVEKNDVLFISERMVACTQGRAIPMTEIKPGFLAKLLSTFVTKSDRGIGLGIPETMQCAIDELGVFRILLASFVGMIGKIFGQKGWFYKIAGFKAAGIDGPCNYTIPPYNKCVVLAPNEPDKEAKMVSDTLGGVTVIIIDANDFGVNIFGCSDPSLDTSKFERLLKQNPLGQAGESTPMGILRAVPAA